MSQQKSAASASASSTKHQKDASAANPSSTSRNKRIAVVEKQILVPGILPTSGGLRKRDQIVSRNLWITSKAETPLATVEESESWSSDTEKPVRYPAKSSSVKKSGKTGNRQGGVIGRRKSSAVAGAGGSSAGGKGAVSLRKQQHSTLLFEDQQLEEGIRKDQKLSENQNRTEEKANTTGSCASSSCLVGVGRSNSVYPQQEGGNMTDSNTPGNGATGGGGSGAVAGEAAGMDPNSDQMEMGRLQAILEARGLPGHIWGALGPRMQSLLGRHPHQAPNSKIQPLLQGIQKSEDESQQLQSVIELCNILVMGNEETLGSQFPVKDVVRALMQLLQMEHNFDVMNHACRAITYLMEALPRSTPIVVEAVPLLIERLHRIECMDVAEQALTALELLSRRHAKNILVAGGISACLSYLDFFSLVPQRTSLQISANCCTHLSPEEFHYVQDSLPLLTQKLCQHDKKSVESVCTLFTRLVDNFLGHPDKLRSITERGLLQNVQQLLVVSPPVISTGIFVSIVRMVHLLCAHCTELAVQLLKQNVVETLRYLLIGSSEPSATDVELVTRTPQEQHEIVVLIGELMPRLPKDGIFEVDSLLRRQPAISDHVVWSWKDDRGLWRPYTAMDSRILEAAYQSRETEVNLNAMGNTYTVDLENMMQINDDTGTSRQVHRRVSPAALQSGAALAVKENGRDARLEFLKKEPEIVEEFVRSLFPVLYEVYCSSAGPAIRHECLRSILRIVYHSDSDVLKEVLKNLMVSSHIANMLSSNDMKIVVGAVQLAKVLLGKMPNVFNLYFRREGVLHQVERLTTLPSPAVSANESPQKSASDPSLPAVGVSEIATGVSNAQTFSTGALPPTGTAPYPLLATSQHSSPLSYYGLLSPSVFAASEKFLPAQQGNIHKLPEVNANIELRSGPTGSFVSSCRFAASGRTPFPVFGASDAKGPAGREESAGGLLKVPIKAEVVTLDDSAFEPMDTTTQNNGDKKETLAKSDQSQKGKAKDVCSTEKNSSQRSTRLSSKRRTNSLNQDKDNASITTKVTSCSAAATRPPSSSSVSKSSSSRRSIIPRGQQQQTVVKSVRVSSANTTSAGRRSSSTDTGGIGTKGGGPAAKKSSGPTAIMNTIGHLFRRTPPSGAVGNHGANNNNNNSTTTVVSAPSAKSKSQALSGFSASLNQPLIATSAAPPAPPPGMTRFLSMTSSSAYHHLVSSQLSAHSSMNKEKVRQWIRSQAKELIDVYFGPEKLAEENQDGVNVLNRLSRVAEDLLVSEVDLGTKPLEDLKGTVVESDVSSFEILHSGLIAALLKYLTHENDSKVKSLKKDRDTRLKLFCSVFLNVKQVREKYRCKVYIDSEDEEPALGKLVLKLIACLNQIEQFPVKIHELPGGPQGSLRGSNALRFFHTHQIKCMLRRHPSCKDLREWHRGPIKVDPLAQISAIERYMLLKGYGRVRQTDSHEDDSSDDGGSDEDLEEVLAMGGIVAGQHRIRYLINDKELPYDMTLYQAVRQYGLIPHGNSTDTDTDTEMGAYGYAAIWVNTHTLWYKLVDQEQEENGKSTKNSSTKSLNASPDSKSRKSPNSKEKRSPKNTDPLWHDGVVPERVCPLKEYLVDKLPTALEDPGTECLILLRVLYGLNRYWWALYQDQLLLSYSPVIPRSDFVNTKLAAKVNRQLQDPLTVLAQQIPTWIKQLAFACPFILPFESRQSLFYAIAFDRDRALQRLLDTLPDLANQTEAGGERIAPRLEKRKMCIQREDLLKQAEHVLSNMDGSSRAVLEIQYQNEEGTGLGPTLEFYALVSKDLQRYKLELWRGDKVELKGDELMEDFVFNGQGLYPQLLPRNSKQTVVSKVTRKFLFIGRFLARALMDSRMVDIPLSPLFYKWLLGQEGMLSLADLTDLDPTVLKSLQAVAYAEGGSKEVESLDLDFTLPGVSQLMELKKGGKDTAVNIENAKQYIQLVAHWLLYEGVSKQMEAVVEGFGKIVSAKHLKMFYPEEMEQLFCGSQQDSFGGTGHWDPGVITQYIRPDHGYSHDSQPVQWLVQIMASFNLEEQRRFLHFITGSPKLPVGGFRSLNPPLTVVRKGHDGSDNPDLYLPSVMTCVNYLKLPEYSSVEVMKGRLEVAMNWGQKSFHLS